MSGARPTSRAVRGSRTAAISVGVLLLALAAGPLAPYPPDLQEDIAGARFLPPWTQAHAVPIDDHRVWVVTDLARDADGWTATRAGRTVRLEERAVRASAPRRYLAGTDGLGRDLASRILHGARQSILVAGLSVLLALAIGLLVGAASGLAGGLWDAAIMRAVDVFLAVPRLLVYLFFATVFPPSVALLVLVLGGTTWPGMARLIRAETVVLRHSGPVEAARASGCDPFRLFVRHVLPRMGPIVAASATLRFADTMVLEAALSFLGLGPGSPAVSLGGILAGARDGGGAWWLVFGPGGVLVLLVLALRSTVSGFLRRADPPSVV